MQALWAFGSLSALGIAITQVPIFSHAFMRSICPCAVWLTLTG